MDYTNNIGPFLCNNRLVHFRIMDHVPIYQFMAEVDWCPHTQCVVYCDPPRNTALGTVACAHVIIGYETLYNSASFDNELSSNVCVQHLVCWIENGI